MHLVTYNAKSDYLSVSLQIQNRIIVEYNLLWVCSLTPFKVSCVSFQMAPNNFLYNFYRFPSKFIEVFIMFLVLSVDRTQSLAYKQGSEELQQEINHFKMNYQIQ